MLNIYLQYSFPLFMIQPYYQYTVYIPLRSKVNFKSKHEKPNLINTKTI